MKIVNLGTCGERMEPLFLQLDHGALDGADRIRQCIGD